MKVHHQALPEIDRYLQAHRFALENHEGQFRALLRLIEKGCPVGTSTRILEIGIGPGWFPILCARRGIPCKGLEISPQLIAFAREFGGRYGVELDLDLANAEDYDFGRGQYDVIVAASVFEHIEHWRPVLRKVYDALQPGGVLVFDSTNKFSFVSHEYRWPLYGWLPDRWRYRLRVARQGPDVMKLGIDFHQFTYPQLRRAFRQAGFRRIMDPVDIAASDEICRGPRRAVVNACRALPPLRHLVLLFANATAFVCVK